MKNKTFKQVKLEEIFGPKKSKRKPPNNRFSIVESLIQKERLKLKIEALEKLLKKFEETPFTEPVVKELKNPFIRRIVKNSYTI